MATDATRLGQNKGLVRRLHRDVWNGRDLDAVDELLAPDYVEHVPFPPGDVRGRQAYARRVARFHEAFSSFELVTEDVIAEGDVVVVRHTSRGVHDGEFLGIAPTGTRFDVPGAVVHRLDGGRVAEAWVTVDALGLLVQLGAVPPPWGDD